MRNTYIVFSRYPVWVCLFLLLALIFSPCQVRGETIANVTVVHTDEEYPAGNTCEISLRIDVEKDWYLHGIHENDSGLIPTSLTFIESPDVKIKDVRFPDPKKKKFEYSSKEVDVYSGEILVNVLLNVAKNTPSGKHTIEGRLSYQPCAATFCLPPETVPVHIHLKIGPTSLKNVYSEKKTKTLNQKRSGEDGTVEQSSRVSLYERGFWISLLGIFIGGLALNLTPCIYPLIPITVSYFGGRSETMKGKTVIHGLLYISGLALTNSMLGLFAGLTGGMLGSVLQNPVVLFGVAAILVGLAFSFFGFWELQLPSGLMKIASKNYGGFFGTFFMGLTLGLVAAPCLGPFILALLTYVGQKGDPLLGFIYFFVLSIGMGLPLTILAIFSGALEKLPMSGEWMIWVKKLLGWVLVVMAGYMLLPLIPQWIGKTLFIPILVFSGGIHLGWLEGNKNGSDTFGYVKKIAGIILVTGAAVFLFLSIPASNGVVWVPYDVSVLESAKGKKPVVIDFYADWCGPCKALDKIFSDSQIVEQSKHFVMVRADMTGRQSYQEELLGRFAVRGFPSLIFIDRNGNEDRALRIESLAGKEEILERMGKIIYRHDPVN